MGKMRPLLHVTLGVPLACELAHGIRMTSWPLALVFYFLHSYYVNGSHQIPFIF